MAQVENDSRCKTILFDIDGTLIRTGGAGMLAINQVFKEMFGVDNEVRVPVHGRTDFGILGDLFAANEIDFDSNYTNFSSRYHELLGQHLKKTKGVLLPGVVELLEHLRAQEFALGIVTGNAATAAAIKLQHFGLTEFFAFGGYGDSFRERNHVAEQAVASAQRCLGNKFAIADCWVIGDTPADVTCAKHVGAKAIAVLTGGLSRNDFSDCAADVLVDDLTKISPEQFH